MPTNAPSCINRIERSYPDLKQAERQLADYILRHKDLVIGLTLQQLEQHSQISYSTIGRFCKRLGYLGYKELRHALTEELLHHTRPHLDAGLLEYEAGSADSLERICQRSFSLFGDVLRDCGELLEPETLNAVAQAIVHAKTLHILGVGASASSGMYANTRLMRLGIPCSFESDVILCAMKASLMTKNDVLLVISSTGRTKSIVDIAQIALERRATVISISDYRRSPIQGVSTYCLYTTTRSAAKYGGIDLPFTFCQLALIDVLYSCCIRSMGERGQYRYEQTRDIVERYRIVKK